METLTNKLKVFGTFFLGLLLFLLLTIIMENGWLWMLAMVAATFPIVWWIEDDRREKRLEKMYQQLNNL
ncbi:hypothetical protein [Glaesserella sp.]|uniref:hypothetical protein n=1 Tax=Glaesserella sp. TaxID=2094731 RepID=UPI0035A08EDD